LFNPQKEKETFMEARRDFFTTDHGASTSQVSGDQIQNNDEIHVYGIPPIFDSSISAGEKVNPLKYFLQSILSLLKDDEALAKHF